jgi:O-antigen/teichoic acid export membrane protein
LVWTGTIMVTVLGVVAALLGALFVPYLVHSILNMPAELHRETIIGMYVLAGAGPLVALNGALWGIISAFQKFAAANLVNIPVLTLYYLGPIAVLQFDDSLVAVMAVLLACRAAMTVAYVAICLKSMPALRHVQFDARAIRPVLAFGSWITLSNVLYPVTLYLDRFVIGSLVSVSATAYYATPSDLINRFWVLPVAVMNAVFPAMAAEFRVDSARTASLFRRSMVFISATVFPGCVCAIALPGLLLDIWLGHDFSQHAAPILRYLGIGIFFNCLTFVPTGLLDSIGRFDVNAKLAAVQTSIYVPVMFVLVHQLGIEGAAFAWLGRASVGFVASMLFAGRLYPPVKLEIWKILPELAGAGALMALPLLVPGLVERIGVMAIVVLLYFVLIWLYSLTPDERHYARVKMSRVVPL